MSLFLETSFLITFLFRLKDTHTTTKKMNSQPQTIIPPPILCTIISFADLKERLTFRATCKLFAQYVSKILPPIGRIAVTSWMNLRGATWDPTSQTLYFLSDEINKSSKSICNKIQSFNFSTPSPTLNEPKLIGKPFAKNVYINHITLDIERRIIYFTTSNTYIGYTYLDSNEVYRIEPRFLGDECTYPLCTKLSRPTKWHGSYGPMVLDSNNNCLYAVSESCTALLKISFNGKEREGKKAIMVLLYHRFHLYNSPSRVSCYGLVLNLRENCLYWSDRKNAVIRVYSLIDHTFKVLCGVERGPSYKDGPLDHCQFQSPSQMALGDNGETLYVADHHLIRKIDLKQKQVSTLCGNPEVLKVMKAGSLNVPKCGSQCEYNSWRNAGGKNHKLPSWALPCHCEVDGKNHFTSYALNTVNGGDANAHSPLNKASQIIVDPNSHALYVVEFPSSVILRIVDFTRSAEIKNTKSLPQPEKKRGREESLAKSPKRAKGR